MSVEVEVVYEGQLHCRATHGPSGSTLVTEAPVDNGGKGELFSPTDLVAVAVGTCVLTVMGLVAQRRRLDIAGTRVQVIKEMAAAPARRIGALLTTVTFPKGRPIAPEDRTRLENDAEICPVKRSLHPDVLLELHFEYPD